MYAVFRSTQYASDGDVVASPAYRQFNDAHAAQPGYRGTIIADAGDGQLLTVTLWDSADAMNAAREVLGPVVGKALGPMMTAPAVLLGAGRVVVNDLVPEKKNAPNRAR